MSRRDALQAAARTPAARGRGSGSWRSIAWRDAPSWLTSAVIHLSVLILLGLLFSAAETTEVRPLALSWTADTQRAETEEIEPPDVPLAGPTAEPAPAEANAAQKSPRAAIAKDEPPAPAQTPAATPNPSAGNAASVVASAGKLADMPVVQPVSLVGGATAPAESIQASPRGDGSAKVSAPRSAEMVRYERLAGANGDDALVARFTLADIGKLTGRQGEEAKAEFKRLGTEAIPALVRGLNRSANIAHSCPVAEIYRKLDELLARTDDPYLLLYVLENTGRGVHPRAEHWQQIVAARNAWQKKYGDQAAPLRERLDSELRPKRALEAGRPLSEADADELALAVAQTNPKLRAEALATIAQRGMTFGDADRYQIAQPLIAQLEDAEPEVRRSARQTLIALSGGREIGPSESALDRDPPGAAAWWRDRWTQHVISQSLARGRSAEIVGALLGQSRRDRVDAARELAEQSPVLAPKQRVQAGRALVAMLADADSEVQALARAALRSLAHGTDVDVAAGEAQAWNEYWAAIELRQVLEPQAGALLGQARSLGERGAADAARRYYERIVREFPHTSAAAVARQRLEK
jgi:hypothetical protein